MVWLAPTLGLLALTSLGRQSRRVKSRSPALVFPRKRHWKPLPASRSPWYDDWVRSSILPLSRRTRRKRIGNERPWALIQSDQGLVSKPPTESVRAMVTRQTLLSAARVVLPAVLATALGVSYYDNLSRYINENFLDSSSISFLSSDDIQFIPSFLTVISLLFSILAGNAYDSLYSQQEEIYLALYREVSDAKSLLEQLGLVCSGRPFYADALRMLQVYIKTDLRRLDLPPAELIARSPSEDPLESIMFLTSIGVPSVVYETVRDLRQARGYRLGAMQKKTPVLTIVLLYILAFLELAAFPLLGAGTAVGASESIFKVQGALFGGLCGASVLVLRIIQELWRTSGGAFNVDIVLAKMVQGLTEELDLRARLAPRGFDNVDLRPPPSLVDAIGQQRESDTRHLQNLTARIDSLERLLLERLDGRLSPLASPPVNSTSTADPSVAAIHSNKPVVTEAHISSHDQSSLSPPPRLRRHAWGHRLLSFFTRFPKGD